MKAKSKPFSMRKRCVLISTPFPRLEDGFIDGRPAICSIIEMHGTVNVKYWVQFSATGVGDVEFFALVEELYPEINITRLSPDTSLFTAEAFKLLGHIDGGVWVHENLATANDTVSRHSDDSKLLDEGAVLFGSDMIEVDGNTHRSSFSYISSAELDNVASIGNVLDRIKTTVYRQSFQVPVFTRPKGKLPIVFSANGGTVCWFKKKGYLDSFMYRVGGSVNVLNFHTAYAAGRFIAISDLSIEKFTDRYDAVSTYKLISWMSVNYWMKEGQRNVQTTSFMYDIGHAISALYSIEEIKNIVGKTINGIRIPGKESLLASFHQCIDLIPKKAYGQVAHLNSIDTVYCWQNSYLIIQNPMFVEWKHQCPMVEFCYLKYALLFKGRDFDIADGTVNCMTDYMSMQVFNDIDRSNFIKGHGKIRELFYDAIVYLYAIPDAGKGEQMFLISEMNRMLDKIKFAL